VTLVFPHSTPARLWFTLCFVCNLQATSAASLTELHGVHLADSGAEYLEPGEEAEGSLERFTALCSLYLRQTNGGSMIEGSPPLPCTLRCGDEIECGGSDNSRPDVSSCSSRLINKLSQQAVVGSIWACMNSIPCMQPICSCWGHIDSVRTLPNKARSLISGCRSMPFKHQPVTVTET